MKPYPHWVCSASVTHAHRWTRFARPTLPIIYPILLPRRTLPPLIEINSVGHFEGMVIQVPRFVRESLVVMTWRSAPLIVYLLLTWTVADADHVYGWIDQQGDLQYSDRPATKPPEQGYLVPVPPSVEERIEHSQREAWHRQVAEYEKLHAEIREAAVRREAEEEMRQRYCEDAHAHLIYFSYPGRQYVRKGITGEWTAVDSEERVALIEHWQRMVDDLCE